MRPRKAAPRAGSAGADEVAGFLEGVRQRLLERRRDGAPLPDLEQRLAGVPEAIANEDLAEAERRLLDVSERLDRDEVEPELNEFPRGLVAYDAGADRGIPTPEDEEPVGNRLTLVERLVTVAAAEGVPVEDLRGALRLARAAYEAGDRRGAKETGERILDELDDRRKHRSAAQR
ncbi:MAG TPA: hypothetical protein VGP88_04930 [Thermoplasmata archaeon]|jgi:hypothetical protein|nr:hypothetical protein [Thermoplasmata archaeon]